MGLLYHNTGIWRRKKVAQTDDLFVVLSALRLDGVFLFFHYRSFPFTYNGLLPE